MPYKRMSRRCGNTDRFRALYVMDKSERVYHFHYNTMESLSELVAAMGSDSPSQLKAHHLLKRIGPNKVLAYDNAYDFLEEGVLVAGSSNLRDFRGNGPWPLQTRSGHKRRRNVDDR